MKTKKGFTLIEILVVVALIAILAAITFVAMNPAQNFAATRNATRSADLNTLLTTVSNYLIEDGNSLATLETAAGATLATCGDATTPWRAIGTTAGNVNLQAALVDEYISTIPADPSGGTAGDTGYDICKTAAGRIHLRARNAELSKTIEVRR